MFLEQSAESVTPFDVVDLSSGALGAGGVRYATIRDGSGCPGGRRGRQTPLSA
jgi:hypothetical protein